MEKMLVTQALDERDLLVKKINDKICKAAFVDVAKANDTKTIGRKNDKKEFGEEAKAAFQQINDLIDRFIRIDQAISASNAVTKITTSFGEMTVAGAISFRGRMRGNGPYLNASFEEELIGKLSDDLQLCLRTSEKLNSRLNESAEGMRLSILGKDSKVKDDKPLDVVDAYVRENTAELVDPLDARTKVVELRDRLDGLLKEIDTQIKVSNATTMIEF